MSILVESVLNSQLSPLHLQLSHHPFYNLVSKARWSINSLIWNCSAPEGTGHNSSKPITRVSTCYQGSVINGLTGHPNVYYIHQMVLETLHSLCQFGCVHIKGPESTCVSHTIFYTTGNAFASDAHGIQIQLKMMKVNSVFDLIMGLFIFSYLLW